MLSMMRLPPAGASFDFARVFEALGTSDPVGSLNTELSNRLSGRSVRLHRSGRKSMRMLFEEFARLRGAGEIIIPAYTCYSIAAAVVAAGLKVRLVDVDRRGQISTDAVDTAELGNAAALVVGNLFGVPESIASIGARLRANSVALIDDAAQSFGAVGVEGPVGARGDAGVLSFGRAKPLSGLGGGASVHATPPPGACRRIDGESLGLSHGLSVGLATSLRAMAWNLALQPAVFRLLTQIPGLGIGETHFDPKFPGGPMQSQAVVLTSAALLRFDQDTAARRRRALALAAELQGRTVFEPLLSEPGEEGVYPRLGVLAPSPAARERALRDLASAGVTSMYPEPLSKLAALRDDLVGSTHCPGAERMASHVLTLPTHEKVTPAWQERIVSGLESIR